MLDKQRQHWTVSISCSMGQACHLFVCAEREGAIILPPLS